MGVTLDALGGIFMSTFNKELTTHSVRLSNALSTILAGNHQGQ